MIKIPTVLVLGAGASMPFGFPSGQGLVDIICHFLLPDRIPRHSWIPDWLHEPMNDTGALLKTKFKRKAIGSFLEHLNGEESIDAFLEHQTGDFLKIGKAAIAAALLPFEREEALFNDFTIRRLEKVFTGEQSLPGSTDNWYQLLWSGMEAPFDKFDENKLHIITFNYDRSLEHYLITRLKRRYPGHKDGEYKAKMPEIAHIHGRLGYLRWQTAGEHRYEPVPYGAITPPMPGGKSVATLKDMWFDAARETITVIYVAQVTNELKQAREWIRDCKRLYFLGFGFHPVNIERLGIHSLNEKKLIMATIKGLSYGRIRDVKRLMSQACIVGFKQAMFDVTNYDFLHDQVDLTMG